MQGTWLFKENSKFKQNIWNIRYKINYSTHNLPTEIISKNFKVFIINQIMHLPMINERLKRTMLSQWGCWKRSSRSHYGNGIIATAIQGTTALMTNAVSLVLLLHFLTQKAKIWPSSSKIYLKIFLTIILESSIYYNTQQKIRKSVFSWSNQIFEIILKLG